MVHDIHVAKANCSLAILLDYKLFLFDTLSVEYFVLFRLKRKHFHIAGKLGNLSNYSGLIIILNHPIVFQSTNTPI